MVRLLALALLILAAPALASAACPASLSPYGYQQLTVSTSAVGLTVPAGAQCAEVLLGSNTIRLRDDGTNPTSSVGVPYGTGFPASGFTVFSHSMSSVKFIRQGSSDSELNALFYGP